MAQKRTKKLPVINDSPQEALLRANLLKPCETKEQLQKWIRFYLDVDLVDYTVSRFSNSNPLQACWDFYSSVMWYSGDSPTRIMNIASRSSQKTLMLSVAITAILLHRKENILHYAGTLVQAGVLHGYVSSYFTSRHFLKDLVVGKPTQDDITVRIPKNKNEKKDVTLKIWSLSVGQIHGQHSSIVTVDELAVLDHIKRKLYLDDLNYVLDSAPDGKSGVRVEISSRKGAFSVVEQNIAKASEIGLVIKKWNVLDVTERCPDERSGVIPTKYYGSPYLGTVATEEQYQNLPEMEKSKFSEAHGFDKCPSCPVASNCLSDLKNQKSTSKAALRPIAKLIADYKTNSLEHWLSQALSLLPSQEGLIYSKYKPELHLKTVAGLYKIATGEEPKTIVGIHSLIKVLKEKKYRLLSGVDHSGGTSAASILVGALAKDNSHCLILESWEGMGVDIEELATVLKRVRDMYEIEIFYPDPSAVDRNKLLSKKGFRLHTNFKREISAGIEIVRSRLMSADGTISLYFLDDATKPLQYEISKYHYKQSSDSSFTEDPDDEYNHHLDALRYLLQNIYGKTGQVLAPEYTAEEKKLIEQQDMVGGQPIEEWLQKQINDAIDANRRALGLDPAESDEVGKSGSGAIKWII